MRSSLKYIFSFSSQLYLSGNKENLGGMNANREQVDIFYEIDDYEEMALLYNSRKIPQNLAMEPSTRSLHGRRLREIDPLRGPEFVVFVAHVSL